MSGRAPKPERRRRRNVLTIMGGPYTSALLGGALLAAVALGIHLGESTVGLIDPIHYRGPAVHPRDRGAALDERALARRPRPAPAHAGLYGWDEGRAARLAECGDCGGPALRGQRTYSAVVPYFGGSEGARVAAEPVPEVRVHRGGVPEDAWDKETSVPDRRLERYAHYPLTYEDAAFPDEAGEGEEAPLKPRDRARWQ